MARARTRTASRRARIVVALLLPLCAAAGMVRAYSVYRCRYDGIARRSCCCPTTNESASTATIGQACCCDVATVRIAPAPSTITSPGGDKSVAPAIGVAPMPPDMPMPCASTKPPPERSQRIHGPPLVLLKRSFLI